MLPKGTKLEDEDELLPYEMGSLTESLRTRAKSELFEVEETRANTLRQFISVLDAEPKLKYQDDDLFLLAFLRARKFDVERAFDTLKTFYTVVGKRSELYSNFNFDDVKRTIEANIFGFLPYRDSEGCVILVIRVEPWRPQIISMGDIMRGLTGGLIHAILSPATQVAGFKVIVDFSGISAYHLPCISPTYLWLFAEALQNCFPGRFKAIHIVNEGSAFAYIWIVLKHFLKRKMRDRFHFHGKNVKNLHNFFSPRILPAQYEGELPSFDNKEWGKMVEENADYITKAFSYGYQKQNKTKT